MPDENELAGRIVGASRDLIREASSMCDRDDRASEENIHQIRLNLKRVRAYWRLLRYAAGKEAEKTGNRRCSTAGKLLAHARDKRVMHDTLESLAPAEDDNEDASAFTSAKEKLGLTTVPASEDVSIDWDTLKSLLDQEHAEWVLLSESTMSDKKIRQGLDRTFRKARRGYKCSKKSPDAGTLHGWRKWVKRYRYQLELLSPDEHKTIKKLDKLGDKLGLNQDLAVLLGALNKADGLEAKHRKAVRKVIAKRQSKLTRKALKNGKKLFKSKNAPV